MSNTQAGLWEEIASMFQQAAKEQKKVLSYHYDAYNRGWLGGLQLGRQRALLFSHSVKTNGSLIPETLQSPRSFESLFDDFVQFLIDKLTTDADKIDQDLPSPDMDELASFRAGRLAGLQDFKKTSKP